MGRTDSRKKILDVEQGSVGLSSDHKSCRRTNKTEYKKKSGPFTRHLPSILPSRKLGHINFSDHYTTHIVSHILETSSTSQSKLAPSSSSSSSCSKPFRRQLTWFRNNRSYAFFLFFITAANFVLFGRRVWQYQHVNVLEMMARAFGQCLNLNCALLLALILRRSVTRLRNSPLGALLPCDNHVHLHKMAGWAVFFCSVMHTIFHLSNFAGLSEVTGVSFWSYMIDSSHGIGWAWGLANQTGIALLFMLCIIVLFSHRCIRKSGYFEVFYFTHLLSLPFWVLLILHGPSFWMWLLVPGTAFLSEACLRITQIHSARGKTSVVAVEKLPSQVIKLIIQRPVDFEFRAGEYIYLNIPSIARHEWHPFTISSAPEQEDTFSVHIRTVGGWTGKMFEVFGSSPVLKLNPSLLEPHNLVNNSNNTLKTCSTGSLNKDCPAIMEGSLDSGEFAGKARGSFEELPTSRYYANLMQFNRKVSTIQPAVLLLENEVSGEKPNVLTKRTRKRSSSLSSLNFSGSDMGQWSPHHLDSGNTSLTGSCSSLQNIGQQTDIVHRTAIPQLGSSPQRAAQKLYEHYRVGTAISIQPVEVFVDGPYGTPSSSIFKVSHAVLVGAGIGVTPFASILQSVMYRYRSAKVPCPHCQVASCVMMPTTLKKLRKVDFIWVNRDVSHFEWFLELLASMESEQSMVGTAMERFLRLQLYNTGDSPLDAPMPLASVIKSGRPDWDKVLGSLRDSSRGKQKVCVFYCGPPALAGTLRDLCHKYRLDFRREMF